MRVALNLYKDMHRLVVLVFRLSFCVLVTETTVFHRTTLCDVNARLSKNCMTADNSLDSILKCCVRCDSNNTCVGASLQTDTNNCYYHSVCKSVSGCNTIDNSSIYFEKTPKPLPCVRGTWNQSTGLCKCVYHYVGQLCDRVPYNCSEFAQNWPWTNGPVMIQLLPPQLTRVVLTVCSRTKTSLTTVFLRSTGEYNFNQTLASYVKPFNTPCPPFNQSFWIGLETMRVFMGSNPRNISINIILNTGSIADKYTGVTIGDSSTNYVLTFDAHTTLPKQTDVNCLGLSNMTLFSTADADHDGDSTVNWASVAGAGWWFPAMNYTCNPLGMFYNNAEPLPINDDGYIRFPGLSKERLANNLVRVEMAMDEDYV